jgi:hypothetical protein
MIVPRLGLLTLALMLTLVSALFFDRFSSSGRPQRKKPSAQATELPTAEASPAVVTQPSRLTPLPVTRSGFAFGRLFLAEWRLTVRGQPWWWYLAALGYLALSLLVPLANLRGQVLPLALIWPLLVWSGLGCREARHATGPIVFSAPHPLWKQLPAAWLSGWLVALLLGGGALFRFGLAGDLVSLTALLAGLLFIPSLALALGVWTGASKAFEVVYAVFWYLGVLNDVLELDYAGLHASGNWPIYLALSVLLLAAALLGRQRQIRG